MPNPKDPNWRPKLTHHKASGRGVLRLNGKDEYCGCYGTPECRAEYLRQLAAWEARVPRHAKERPDGPRIGFNPPASPT